MLLDCCWIHFYWNNKFHGKFLKKNLRFPSNFHFVTGGKLKGGVLCGEEAADLQ